MFFRVHSSNIMGTSGSIWSTLKTQTSNRDESSSNVSTRTIKRNDADSSLGISYCCFDILEIFQHGKLTNFLLITIPFEAS